LGVLPRSSYSVEAYRSVHAVAAQAIAKEWRRGRLRRRRRMNRPQDLAGEPGVVQLNVCGQSHGDLLQQPTVAVGIAERSVRGIALTVRIQAANHSLSVSMMEYAARVVEWLADLDATTE
jgi:hypothetical protein